MKTKYALSPEQEQKKLVKERNLMWIGTQIILLIAILLMINTTVQTSKNLNYIQTQYEEKLRRNETYYHPETVEETTTTYLLDKKDTENAKKIHAEINPLYLIYTKNIEYTTDITLCDICTGIQLGQQIIIEYTNNEEILKERICHELAHTFTYHSENSDPYKDKQHAIIYELANTHYCFQKSNTNYIQISKLLTSEKKNI